MYIQSIKNQWGKITSLIRENYREDGKVKHRTIANISKLPPQQIQQIKAILSGDKVHVFDPSDLKLCNVREYGASAAVIAMMDELGLRKILHSRPESWKKNVMAMIAGRLVYQGSKLALTNMYNSSVLWELAGHEQGVRPDVEKHCYEPLDRLLERQPAIQAALAKTHLQDGCLILYDITSSYVEGEYADSDLVAYGYNRDGKRGHEQIVVGLLTNKEGCPVAVEVFKGNTSDQTTVLAQAKKLANDYGVKSVVFTGDRGMLTPKRIEEVTELGYKTLTALTHPQIRTLLEKDVIQLGLFDEKNLVEVHDPDSPKIRYVLNKNPDNAERETRTRNALIAKTKEALEKLKDSKKKRTNQELSAAVGRALSKYHTGKFYMWTVVEGVLTFEVLLDLVEAEQGLDGCYIIRTDVSAADMTTAEVRQSYKQLAQVEKAFRNLKTVSLEMRPIYHHNDDRIKAHVFLCMLAYYVQWHMIKRLQPLFEMDGKGKNRRWSFVVVLEELKMIVKGTIQIDSVPIEKISTPNAEQQKIIDLLKIKL
jgi:transposase